MTTQLGRALALPAIILAAFACGAPAAAADFDHAHPLWSELLGKYVDRRGQVSYGKIKERDQGALDAYLGELQAVEAGLYKTFSPEQKLAFWLNAYNAYTVKLILNHYPLASIREIGFLPLAAFREEFIPLRALGSDEMSLNDIEHEVIRKGFAEPRIHFALVCASKSCPALRSEAYRARDLEVQLEDQTRTFINDPEKNRFDAERGTLYLSSIFNWFDDDFVKHAKGVVPFVSRYLNHGQKPDAKVAVEFLSYDWSLNGK